MNETDNLWNAAVQSSHRPLVVLANRESGLSCAPTFCQEQAVNRATDSMEEARAMGQLITVEELPRYAPGELKLDSASVGRSDFRLRIFRYQPSD
ncbi:MAG TPA: hypothetical protein VF583_21985, partial [Bradyrhizobium sp.]